MTYKTHADNNEALTSLMNLTASKSVNFFENNRDVIIEAYNYLVQLFYEKQISLEYFEERLEGIIQEILRNGYYWHTDIELNYGAKLAWRNSNKCIGRIYWQSLIVRDERLLNSAEEVFNSIVEHIKIATNNGSIRSVISIFSPLPKEGGGIRIWNPLLIRYAYLQDQNGFFIGDPAQKELTEICRKLGWTPSNYSNFEVLPLIIQMPGECPKLFEIPKDIILEVEITHPKYEWFSELGLKWNALPSISNHRLEIGGISYTAAPFSGWYMVTEIASRNFGDESRYNLLPIIAEKMGLNTRSKISLWKDQALVELNVAVLHSFSEKGVSIIDHHTASKQFIKHTETESKHGRQTYADWGYIVPPMSASATEVFHTNYENKIVVPNFFPQPEPYSKALNALPEKCPFH